MNIMKLPDYPIIKIHEKYNSREYNTSETGFKGGQSDFELSRVGHKYIVLSPKNKDINYIFLRGSTTFGVGVCDSQTVPKIFNELNPQKNILNLGLGGIP